jgi:hypothetical protein
VLILLEPSFCPKEHAILKWQKIDNYLDCVHDYVLPKNVEYLDELKAVLKTKDYIKKVSLNFPNYKNDPQKLQTLLDQLYIESDKVYAILSSILDDINKATPGPKSDPRSVYPQYEKLYKDFQKEESTFSSAVKKDPKLKNKRIINFLRLARINLLSGYEAKEPKEAKKLAQDLRQVIWLLEEQMQASWNFLSNTTRANQIAAFNEIIQALETTYNIKSIGEIPERLYNKMKLTATMVLLTAAAKGLYNTLQEMIARIQIQIKNLEAKRKKFGL